MKTTIRLSLIALAISALALPARGQYYQLANQIPQLIQPALMGGFNYKGFVDAGYTKGLGNNIADFVEVSTTQGLRYSNWFFMGVGLGIDVIMSESGNTPANPGNWGGYNPNKGFNNTAVGMPLYSDFRFNIGGQNKTSFFADLRLGCWFMLSQDYLQVNSGYLTDNECFYLRPTIGVRIPVGNNGRQAVNVGVTYQLIASEGWWDGGYTTNTALNSLGVSAGFEW